MAQLENLTPGAMIGGLLRSGLARVVQAERLGDHAVKLTFEEPDGSVRNRLSHDQG